MGSERGRDGVRGVLVAARRGQILEAAMRVFARKGFRGATTREIAAEAGISEGTIYNYFGGKDDLLLAVLDGVNESERRADDFRLGMDTGFEEFTREYLRGRMSLLWRDREVLRVVLSEMLVNAELRRAYTERVVEPTMRIGEENLRARMEVGEARQMDVSLGARAMAGAVLGTLVLALLGDGELEARWDEASDVLAGLFVHGLGAPEGGRDG